MGRTTRRTREELPIYPLVYSTRNKLYNVNPQDKDKVYLAEVVLDQVLYVLVN
jgi:hypothetical protein